jgi:hypothetical protein
MSRGHIPHLPIVIGFCVAAIIGYTVFSVWAVFIAHDATMIGDVVGTWKSFAVAAFAFWLGSSSAGKAKDGEPVKTEVVNSPSEPVPTHSTDLPQPERMDDAR